MRLNVVETGSAGADTGLGAPVVLLHGLFGQARNLGRLQRALSADGRVIGLDLRSHGSSPAGRLDLRAMADDVVETLDALAVGPVVLVGHSMGGKVGMATALDHPDRVAGLLVADIAPVAYAHGNERFARAMQGLRLVPGLTRAMADAALSELIAEPAVRALLLQNLTVGERPRWTIGLDEIASSVAEVEGWPEWAQVLRFGGPSLFVRAEQSDYVRPEWMSLARSLFPRARFTTVRDAGHWLHVDQPEQFASIARDFVAAVRSSERSV